MNSTQPLRARQAAIVQAQGLANEYRFFLKYEPELEFRPPTPEEEKAYAILIELEMVHPDSYQWSHHGRKVRALSDSSFNAIFEYHLNKLLWVNSSSIVRAIFQWESVEHGAQHRRSHRLVEPFGEEALPQSQVVRVHRGR